MDYNKSWEQKLKHMDGRVLIWWIYIQSKGFLKIDFKVNSIIQNSRSEMIKEETAVVYELKNILKIKGIQSGIYHTPCMSPFYKKVILLPILLEVMSILGKEYFQELELWCLSELLSARTRPGSVECTHACVNSIWAHHLEDESLHQPSTCPCTDPAFPWLATWVLLSSVVLSSC